MCTTSLSESTSSSRLLTSWGAPGHRRLTASSILYRVREHLLGTVIHDWYERGSSMQPSLNREIAWLSSGSVARLAVLLLTPNPEFDDVYQGV